jgi:hypothetical protein
MNFSRLLFFVSLTATPVALYAAENLEPQNPSPQHFPTPLALYAAENLEPKNPLPRHFPTHERFVVEFAAKGSGGGKVSYHGGPVLTTAYVVPIYWGPSWSTADPISSSLTNYLEAIPGGFGTTGEYNVITQYYQTANGINTYITEDTLCCSTGGPIYDSSTPPTNVTDADLQTEVLKVTNNNPRTDTIYEVFLPKGTFSSDGTATSCGGSNLQYCAYHSSFNSGTFNVKYASMPYPSCGGCQTAGFTDTQNFEHFISHETREAVTDENSNAWYDKRLNELDDKCAWSPTPFTDSQRGTNADGTAFAYQYEWSNADSGCVKTR